MIAVPIQAEFRLTDAGDGVLLVAGELDASTSAQLRRRLFAAPTVRVIDLSAVTFIDASSLTVLLDVINHRHADDQLCLQNPSWCVIRLCEITGLTSTLLEPTDADS